ncbi:hypothetical protein GF325_14005 [Candidatus Bathyarchaeota archaeon]|nr:hypothetical protein [Candidatus Bathyarchaeota archaeon]
MRVAFGKIKITPPGGVIGKPLAGYSPVPRCTGILDDIYAHGILIESCTLGNIRKMTLLISLDFLKIPLLVSSYIKNKVHEAHFDIKPAQVLIHATHTHKSMDMGGEFVYPGGFLSVLKSIMFGAYHSDDKYKVWIARRMVKLVDNLKRALEPAKIGWGKELIEAPIMLNRRHPTRYSKSRLGVISFKKQQGDKLIGVIVNYAMHPTTLSAGITKLSADYPGRIVHKIEQLIGRKGCAAFFTGACGDLNPITTCGTDFELLEKERQRVYGQKGNYSNTKQLGYFLGEQAYRIASEIPTDSYLDEVDIKVFSEVFSVPMLDYKEHRPVVEWIKKRAIHLVKRLFLLRVALLLAEGEEPNFPGFAIKHDGRNIRLYSMVQYIHVSATNGESHPEFSIAGIPGELFEDIARDITREAPTGVGNTFVFENANDWIGYLFPIHEYLHAGGYEPMPSFSPLGGKLVREAMLRLMAYIRNGITTFS